MHVGLGTTLGVGLTASQGRPPYSYNYVIFDGVNDWMSNGTNLGLANSSTFTAAFAFRINSLSAANFLMSMNAGGLELALINTNGSISINSPFPAGAPGTSGFTGWLSAAGTIQVGIDYVLHIAADHTDDTVQVWLNGNVLTPATGATWNGTEFGTPTAWTIGSGAGGVLKLNGRLGLVWYDVGQKITAPSAFFPARSLGANMENPGARPAIGFGDAQTATNWNNNPNPVNLGDGTGTWTMNGGV